MQANVTYLFQAGSIRGDSSGVPTQATLLGCATRLLRGSPEWRTRHDTKAGAPPYLGQIVRPPSCSGIHGGAGSRAGTTDTAGGGENGSG